MKLNSVEKKRLTREVNPCKAWAGGGGECAMPCGATVTAPPRWLQAGFQAVLTGTPELVTHQQRWLRGDMDWKPHQTANGQAFLKSTSLVPLLSCGSGGDTGCVVPSMVTWDRTFPTYCEGHESCLSWWIYNPITSSSQPEQK